MLFGPQTIFKNIFFCVLQKKVSQVWSNMKVSNDIIYIFG